MVCACVWSSSVKHEGARLRGDDVRDTTRAGGFDAACRIQEGRASEKVRENGFQNGAFKEIE